MQTSLCRRIPVEATDKGQNGKRNGWIARILIEPSYRHPNGLLLHRSRDAHDTYRILPGAQEGLC
jgi:hypothetical protein